jgi:hypothetical protein
MALPILLITPDLLGVSSYSLGVLENTGGKSVMERGVAKLLVISGE